MVASYMYIVMIAMYKMLENKEYIYTINITMVSLEP